MNWDLICHVLARFGIAESRRCGFSASSHLMLLTPEAEDWPGVIYVTDESASPAVFRFSLIVSAGPCSIAAENHIALSGGGLAEIFNALAEAKHYLDTLDDVLSRLDDDQSILEAAGMYLNLPFFYLDESYRIRAITRDVVFEHDEEWRHMLKNGFLSPESALKMKESGDLDRMLETHEPIVYRSDIYPFSSVVISLWYEGRFYSRLNMLCVNGDTSPMAVRACEITAAHLERVIGRGGKATPGGPLQKLLLDLLRGEQLSEALLRDRLKAGPFLSDDRFRLFCVDVAARHDTEVGAYYSFLLEKLCRQEPAIALQFDGKILLLAYGADAEGFRPLEKQLSAFLSEQRLRCGVSNMFSDLRQLAGHYGQALAALRSGAKERLVDYRDHMLEHMLSYIPSEQLPFLISPDIPLLQAEDERHALQLTETLKTYLACNCHLARTAEKLFIHKNTLLYRLNRIKSLLHGDLDEADERLLLAISFKLLRRKAADGFVRPK
ncbi:MAG: helix-turn-helix domain-containing protein [Clostridia bacterium]|nr:helix-turn-helix domain-containing protein [Clostridia bacterium]